MDRLEIGAIPPFLFPRHFLQTRDRTFNSMNSSVPGHAPEKSHLPDYERITGTRRHRQRQLSCCPHRLIPHIPTTTADKNQRL